MLNSCAAQTYSDVASSSISSAHSMTGGPWATLSTLISRTLNCVTSSINIPWGFGAWR